MGARADRIIARLRAGGGRMLLFGHGHFSRILAVRWIGHPPGDAGHFMLNTASVSILSYEHALDDPAILLWNDDHHLDVPMVSQSPKNLAADPAPGTVNPA